jgi:hypothetical protein
MSGENGAHMKHVKTPPKKKTNRLPKTSSIKHKPLVDLNDLLEYNTNINLAIDLIRNKHIII